MKRLAVVLLLLVAFSVSAMEINPKLSGIWYNANQNGHGLNIVAYDENTTIVYWYTYHTDGTPMFLITVGANDGNRTTGNTYYNTGMRFGDFDPNDVQEKVWGTSTVTFNGCHSATLEYSSSEPGYGNGTIPMQRLASVSGLKCSDSPLHGTYSAVIVENGQTGFGAATLFENGNMVYYAGAGFSGAVGLGQWRVTGDGRFAFDVTGFSVSGGWWDISGSGTYNQDAVSATYTGGGQLVGTPIPSFQHSLTTSKMAGTYDIHNGLNERIGTLTVDSEGIVSGSTYDGCKFTGGFYVPNTDFNQAYFDAQVSDCGSTTKIYGSAVYNFAQLAIVIAATDEYYGYIWTLK